MPGRMIAYYRISDVVGTRSKAALEAQVARAVAYAKVRGCLVVGRYVEFENRVEGLGRWTSLRDAVAHTKRSKAILLFGHFGELWRLPDVMGLLQESNVEFECCDNRHANRETVDLLAILAAAESKRISDRTKAALAAYRRRGGLLGARRLECRNLTARARRKGAAAAAETHRRNADAFYMVLSGWVVGQRSKGKTLQAIADALNARGTPTRRGKLWNAMQVKRVLERAS